MGEADHTTAVVLPLRSFSGAKARLADVVDDEHRPELVRRMAEQVLKAAQPAPVLVVTADHEVAAWARDADASVVIDPGGGLDAAAGAGVAAASRAGFSRAAVVHGDLPLASDLSGILAGEGVRLVPDRHGEGTNVLTVPTHGSFRFSYGPGSFHRHHDEAGRMGLVVEVFVDADLAFDLDVPADVDVLRREHPEVARSLGLADRR